MLILVTIDPSKDPSLNEYFETPEVVRVYAEVVAMSQSNNAIYLETGVFALGLECLGFEFPRKAYVTIRISPKGVSRASLCFTDEGNSIHVSGEVEVEQVTEFPRLPGSKV